MFLAVWFLGLSGGPPQLPVGPDILDTSEPVAYFISNGEAVAGHDAIDGDLARMAFEAWSRESRGRIRFVEADSAAEALVRLVWVASDSGLFGQARRTFVGGKPGAIVYVTPEVRSLGEDLGERVAGDALLRHAIVYLTCVHELGHAVGLPHTREFEDIMYSFGFGGDIVEYFMRYRRNLREPADIGEHSGLSDGDRAALLGLYGGAP
jgi:hypothetical protein